MAAKPTPPPPDHLSAAAKAAWLEIVPTLGEFVADERSGIEAWAVALARMRDAQRRIDEEGMVVPDDKGRPVEHPALAIERAQAAEVKRWLDRYRKNPRSKL